MERRLHQLFALVETRCRVHQASRKPAGKDSKRLSARRAVRGSANIYVVGQARRRRARRCEGTACGWRALGTSSWSLGPWTSGGLLSCRMAYGNQASTIVPNRSTSQQVTASGESSTKCGSRFSFRPEISSLEPTIDT